MSVQALAWVLEQEHTTTGADRLVLLALANHAGKVVDGACECWPSIATLGAEAGVRRPQTVQQAIRRLEEAGLVEVEVHGAPDGRVRADRRPNLYRLRLDGGTPTAPPRNGDEGAAQRATGVREPLATGVRDAHPEPLVGTAMEPSGQQELLAGAPEPGKPQRHPDAHRLCVLAHEAPVRPVCRGGFVAVLAMLDAQLRAGTGAEDLEAVLREGVEVWTAAGLQTALARRRPQRRPGNLVGVDQDRATGSGQVDL